MHRALRLLACLALLGFALTLVGIGLLLAGVARPGSIAPPGSSSAINSYIEVRQHIMYIGQLFSVAARLTLATSLAAVVVAVVASLQRGQHGWASLLLVAPLLIPYSLSVDLRYFSVWRIFPLVAVPQPSTLVEIDMLLVQQVAGVLVALLVLWYSVSSSARLPRQGRPAPTRALATTPGVTLPEHAHPGSTGAALPLNGLARGLALAGLLGLGISAIETGRVSSGPLLVSTTSAITVVLLLLAWIFSQLAFAAAVVMVVACLQRRQRVWAAVVTGALVLLTGWVALNLWSLSFLPGVLSPFEAIYVPNYFAGEISFTPSLDLLWVGQIAQVVVPALLALVSSLIPAPVISPALPAQPGPAPDTSIGTTGG